MIKDIIVQSVRNNAQRVNVSGKWQDAINHYTGVKLHNPLSVTIEIDGHVEPSILAKLSTIVKGSATGKTLLALCEKVCKDQSREPKLQVEPTDDYIVVMQQDKTTDKMLSYRHSGFTNKKTGEFIERTYIKLEVATPDVAGTQVSDF